MKDQFQFTDTLLAAIHGTPATILLFFLLHPGPHGVDEMATALNYTKNAVTGGLEKLQYHGLVFHDGNRYNGWRLNMGTVRQLPLMNLLDEGDSESRNSRLAPEDPAPIESRFLQLDPAKPTGVVNFETQNENESRNSRLAPTCLSSLSSSYSIKESEELLLKLAAAKQALTQSGLSEEQVADFAARYPPDRVLLACDVYDWASHTPNTKGGLVANDRGYLVKFLTRNWTPPRAYIPAAQRCPHCYRRTSDHAYDCPATRQPSHPDAFPQDPDVETAEDGASPFTENDPAINADPHAQETWCMVTGQLRMSMRKLDYDTWVKDAVPLSLSAGQFTVGAANSDARAWLESRLTSTIDKLLSGILCQPMRVVFVVQ